MKNILLLLLTLISLQSYSQCVECHSFEEALKDPEKVKSLIINPWTEKITLDSIPKSIGSFVNAEIIYLSDHNFSSIPSSIGNLQKLKELSFAGCQLTEVPDELFELKNLEELILWYNDFSAEYLAELQKRFEEEMPNTKVRLAFPKKPGELDLDINDDKD